MTTNDDVNNNIITVCVSSAHVNMTFDTVISDHCNFNIKNFTSFAYFLVKFAKQFS